MKGVTGENLLGAPRASARQRRLPPRLRGDARRGRQLVLHCHVLVNGKPGEHPVFLVKPGRQDLGPREVARDRSRQGVRHGRAERRGVAGPGSSSTRALHGHREDAPGPRRDHAPDQGAAHRRVLLALKPGPAGRLRRQCSVGLALRGHTKGKWTAMTQCTSQARNWRDLIRPPRRSLSRRDAIRSRTASSCASRWSAASASRSATRCVGCSCRRSRARRSPRSRSTARSTSSPPSTTSSKT
jgi:hypothetical protein